MNILNFNTIGYPNQNYIQMYYINYEDYITSYNKFNFYKEYNSKVISHSRSLML